jgi:ABC-type uncharacterized transport system permease subunit
MSGLNQGLAGYKRKCGHIMKMLLSGAIAVLLGLVLVVPVASAYTVSAGDPVKIET